MSPHKPTPECSTTKGPCDPNCPTCGGLTLHERFPLLGYLLMVIVLVGGLLGCTLIVCHAFESCHRLDCCGCQCSCGCAKCECGKPCKPEEIPTPKPSVQLQR